MKLQSGDLRQRIALQVRADAGSVPTPGPAGDEIIAWTDVATYWAKVEPLAGREAMQGDQVKATIDYRITMRNPGPITPLDNRFVFRSTMVLYPQSVIRVDERSAYYSILATYMRGESP